MNPDLVIFDVDGLLLNTEFLWGEAFRMAAVKYGNDKIGDEVYRKLTGISGSDTLKVMKALLPDINNHQEILDYIGEAGMEIVNTQCRPMPGACELLDLLEEKNIRRCVATTTSRNLTELRLKKNGILDRFEYILCGDEVTKRKPDPEIYLKVLQHTGIAASDALVLEDSPYGVEAAFRAGIRVIQIPSVTPAAEKEKKMAARIVRSLHDVAEMLA